jgi:hypothetical protein
MSKEKSPQHEHHPNSAEEGETANIKTEHEGFLPRPSPGEMTVPARLANDPAHCSPAVKT